MTEPDYYRILHVDPGAPAEVIRASYLTLMKQLKKHPDLGGSHQDATLINTAYATLRNSRKRLEYDQSRVRQQRPIPEREEHTTSAHPTDAPTAPVRHCLFCGVSLSTLNLSPNASCNKCGSPTLTAERETLDASELRAISRFPKKQMIRFWIHFDQRVPHTGESTDISPRGMQFVTKQRLSVQHVIRIDCAVCRAVARVAHVSSSGDSHVTGVEFLSLRFKKSRGTFVSARS